jgi:hypothetical protein
VRERLLHDRADKLQARPHLAVCGQRPLQRRLALTIRAQHHRRQGAAVGLHVRLQGCRNLAALCYERACAAKRSLRDKAQTIAAISLFREQGGGDAAHPTCSSCHF